MKKISEELVDLRNANDDLRLRGGALSPLQFDKLNSELNISRNDNLQKDAKIT